MEPLLSLHPSQRTFKLTLAVCIMLSAACRHSNVIEHPASKSHSDFLEVNRISTDGDTAVFEVSAYNKAGYWVMITSSDYLKGCRTGKTYRLLRSEGFKLDTKVAMPPTGYRDFTLRFEGIDPRDTEVDWYEKSGEKAFTGLKVRPEQPAKDEHACRIYGEFAEGNTSARLLLSEANSDMRLHTPVSIPVRNGKFDYTFHTSTTRAMELIKWEEWMDGSWYTIPVFTEETDIHVRYTQPDKRGEVESGGIVNSEYLDFLKEREAVKKELQLDTLYAEAHKFGEDRYSKEGAELFKRLKEIYREADKKGMTQELAEERNRLYEQRNRMEREHTLYSPAYNALDKKIEKVHAQMEEWERKWIAHHPSEAGLYRLSSLLEQHKQREDTAALHRDIAVYQKHFAGKWNKHPMGREIQCAINAIVSIQTGRPYPDYTAENFQGEPLSVGKLIRGKWAVVNLWASWCGPCRTHSRQLIPLYKRYREIFTVVGIAREKDNTRAAEEAIRKDGYPWIQLVDLNDRNRIWQKHNIENVAGGSFLVDPDGILRAIDPTAEEVEAFLKRERAGK